MDTIPRKAFLQCMLYAVCDNGKHGAQRQTPAGKPLPCRRSDADPDRKAEAREAREGACRGDGIEGDQGDKPFGPLKGVAEV